MNEQRCALCGAPAGLVCRRMDCQGRGAPVDEPQIIEALRGAAKHLPWQVAELIRMHEAQGARIRGLSKQIKTLKAGESLVSTDLTTRIDAACIASCSCMTKTPDIEYHDKHCRYRVLEEARRRLAELETELANIKAPWKDIDREAGSFDGVNPKKYVNALLQRAVNQNRALSMLNNQLTTQAATIKERTRQLNEVGAMCSEQMSLNSTLYTRLQQSDQLVDRLRAWLTEHGEHGEDCMGFMAVVAADDNSAANHVWTDLPCTCGLRELLGFEPTQGPAAPGIDA